jgi:NADPH-dependent 2,4-dienoyl-CoA reductase/sulfur reductase-like enzyme
MTALHYVIIGNGVAGVTAAQEIRKLDGDGKITIVSDEDEYYYRASLSEWISNRNTEEMMNGRTALFYDEMRLERVFGMVTQVDPAAHQVMIGQKRLDYDRLLIATGAQPNQISIPGLEESLVFRSFKDARDIQEQVGCCNRVLILGGGILGLELAGALHLLGIKDVAVVQVMDYVGSPLLDRPAAEWLQDKMKADGIELFIADTIEQVDGKEAVFKSGKRWQFDLFVQSVGVKPRFPVVAELNIGRGIQIDEKSQTNLPDVFAAGDCTETYHADRDRWMTTRIWLDGTRQGRAAAYAMTGHAFSMDDTPFFNASYIYTERYGYIGDPHGEDGETFIWKTDTDYRKVRMVDGRLAGGLLLGNRHGMMAMYKAIGKSVTETGPGLAMPDFDWNDIAGNDWDYHFY